MATLQTPISIMIMYFMKKLLLAALKYSKTVLKISIEYSDFINIILADLIIKLSDAIRINEYAIKLVEGKQPPYSLIYSPNVIELEILKTYIETHLKTQFIYSFKSLE